MFTIESDKTINVTRGDIAFIEVSADANGENYKFQPGDVIKINVFAKKNCKNVVLEETVVVPTETETVEIFLSGEKTKIGESISKPKDYWYEIVLNPTTNPQTIVGYDDEGAKIFRLYPEGEVDGISTNPEDYGSYAHLKRFVKGKINLLSTLHGYSAYEIAVINGFKGTEEEWLASLKGDTYEITEDDYEGIGKYVSTDVIRDWLDEHPEATTTVQDGELTVSKMHPDTLSVFHNGYITPHGTSVKGDGVTDDTKAIQSIIGMLNDGDTLVIPSNYKTVISDTVLIDKDINVMWLGEILYKGERDKPALHFKNINKKKIYINSICDETLSTFHGWVDENYTGVCFENLWHCEVYVGAVYNFTTAIQMVASGGIGGGFCNNVFDILTVQNNKIGLDIIGVGVGSWFNANSVNNMWISYVGVSGSDYYSADVDRFGIRQSYKEDCETTFDSIVFNNIKFDVHELSGGTFTAIYLNRAENWCFNDYRLELLSTCKFCDIDMQYKKVKNIVFSPISEYRANVDNVLINIINYTIDCLPYTDIFTKIRGLKPSAEMRLVELCNLTGKHKKYAENYTLIDGWFSLAIGNTDLTNKADEKVFIYTSSTDLTYPEMYESVRYIKGLKKGDTVIVKMNEKTDGGSYVCIKGYDESGVVLNQCVNASAYYFDDGNKVYRPSVNSNNVTFTVADDVETIALLFFGNISNIEILTSSEYACISKSAHNDRIKTKYNYAVVTPTITDGFELNDILFNASSSSNTGWVFLTDGTWYWQEF